MMTVHTKTYPAPPIDEREILRYMGARGESAELSDVVSECISEVEDKLSYKVCYTTLPIKTFEGGVDLGFAKSDSTALLGALSDCHSIILFAATVGIGLDRVIAKSAVSSQVRELAASAIGAERIEALCDEFCRDMERELALLGFCTTKRFSPGYSDLPLEIQRDIFRVLGCEKRIGLMLNESLLMSPSKSVTAIVGIRNL